MRKAAFAVFVLLLVCDVTHTKPKENFVSKMINQFLDKVSNETLTIPEVKLGNESNRFRDIVLSFPDGISKKVVGEGSFGFASDLNTSRLSVVGSYDFKELDLPGLFPVFGKGKFLIDLKGVDLIFNLKVRKNFTTEKFDVEIPKFSLSLQNSTVYFENIMNDPSLADFLNHLFSSLLPDLVKALHGKAIEVLTPVIGYVVNEIIRCIETELVTGKLEECIRNITLNSFPTGFGAVGELQVQ